MTLEQAIHFVMAEAAIFQKEKAAVEEPFQR